MSEEKYYDLRSMDLWIDDIDIDALIERGRKEYREEFIQYLKSSWNYEDYFSD